MEERVEKEDDMIVKTIDDDHQPKDGEKTHINKEQNRKHCQKRVPVKKIG